MIDPGRVIAAGTLVLLTSTFTGMIASSLTTERLALVVEGPGNLPGVSTGAIEGSSADGWLLERGIAYEPVASVADGLAAVASGRLNAFVHDRPLLGYFVAREHADTLELVSGTFGREDYGIALPPDSALREPLNRALLGYLGSDEWEALQLRWLGTRF